MQGSSSSVPYEPGFINLDGSGATLSLVNTRFAQLATLLNPAEKQPVELGGYSATLAMEYDAEDDEWLTIFRPGRFTGLGEAGPGPGDHDAETAPIGLDPTGDAFLPIENYPDNPPDAQNANPIQYQLTTSDGMTYLIDGTNGQIESCTNSSGVIVYQLDDTTGQIVDGNENTLLNISWSGGSSWQGSQINSIQVPGQNAVTYQYVAGNLIPATDQDGNQTSYSYLDATNPQLLTGVTNSLGVNALSAQYLPIAGQTIDSLLASLTDRNGVNIPINYTLAEGAAGIRTTTDAAGNVAEDVYDPYGNVLRSITPLSDTAGNLTGYEVTAADYTYAQDQLGNPSPGIGDVTVLQSIDSYSPFQVNGSDPDSLRYFEQPLPSTLVQETDYVTSGEFLGQVQSTTQPVDFSGTLLKTINSNFAVVNEIQNTIKPLTVVTEIQTPDSAAVSGFDVNVQSIACTVYNTANGQLLDSVKSLLEPDLNPDETGELLASGTAYEFNSAGLPVDSYDITADIQGSLTLNQGWLGSGAVSNIQRFGNDDSVNVYYTTTNADGALAGQVEYSTNAAGQSTYYWYSSSGQTLLSYTYKTITTSGGSLNVWVGTTNVYNDLGQLTDTYSASYHSNNSSGTPTLYTQGSGVDGAIVNTRNNPVYAAPLRTVHNDYNSQGQLADSIDQYGGTTSYVYDANGQTIETLYPNGTETLNVYDDKGHAVWTTNAFNPNDNPNLIVGTNSIYNDLGQVIQTITSQGTSINVSGNSSLLVNAGTLISSAYQYYDSKGQVAYAGPLIAGLAGDPAGSDFNGTPWYNTLNSQMQGPPTAAQLASVFAASQTPSDSHPQYTTDLYDQTGTIPVAAVDAVFTMPPVGSSVTITVNSSANLGAGETVDISGAGGFTVDSVSRTSVELTNLGSNPLTHGSNAAAGINISQGVLINAFAFYNAVIDANGNQTDTYQNALGRTVRTVYADGSFTQTLYSYGGNAISDSAEGITSPDESIVGGGSETATVAQRPAGEVYNASHPAIVTFDYSNASSELTDVYQPAVLDGKTTDGSYNTYVMPRTSYTYDSAGNEITQKDANGNVTTFGYDQNGNQVRQHLQDGETETWTYNANNQVATHVDFDGNTATYTYAVSGEEAGLLQQVVYSGAAGSGKTTQTVSYTYNDLNQQASVTDASGTTTSTYDAFGNLIESQTSEGTIHYMFDPATQNHIETYTANTQTNYGYDDQGRLTSVTVTELNGTTLTTPLVTTYTYDNAGNKLSETLPDGEITICTYDSLNRLIGVTELQPATSSQAAVTDFTQTYTLNPDGTRASSTETQLQPDGSIQIIHSSWTYDAEGRKTHAFY